MISAADDRRSAPARHLRRPGFRICFWYAWSMPEFVPERSGAAFRLLWAGSTQIDRTWDLPLRDPFWRLYRNTDAGAVVSWNGGRLELTPGAVVLIPAWTTCQGRCRIRTQHLFVHFTPVTALRLDAPVRIPDSTVLSKLAATVADQADGSSAWWLQTTALVALALASIGAGPASPDDGRDRLFPALASIEAGLGGPLPVATLAQRCGLGADRFARMFRARLGLAPAAWVRQRRIVAAVELLRTSDSPIEDIASACGFANRHHFTRVFTTIMESSPARYRRSG